MILSPIGHTFVGLWKTPPATFYIEDKKLVRGLFSDPYNTTESVLADSTFAVVRQEAGIVTHKLHINAERLELYSNSLAELFSLPSMVVNYLEVLNRDGAPLEFSIMGLTIEFEITEINNLSNYGNLSTVLLGQNYIAPIIQSNPEFVVESPLVREITFDVQNKSGVYYTVNIQPRTGKSDALYMRVTENAGVINIGYQALRERFMALQDYTLNNFKPFVL